ncbi:hypothetical protein EDB81DRAFT_946321 [Dactylonectria macrodidyma]|uniref:Zn(2)-C6 fungal-type domain-containing protein n=1 Tax=Dactylonectria macrodidyma TaxID=307937 RepID=A0A9P9JC87_9HYPO|nr:hypothetical protein EDB81DRAFT_946321 [Dactylonectria macrodidyma]
MPVSTACDACKLRKVKCDMTEPCANCRISQLCCAYTIIPRKRGRRVGKRTLAGQEVRRRPTPPRPEQLSESLECQGQARTSTPLAPSPPGTLSLTYVQNVVDESAIGLGDAAAQIHGSLMASIRSILPSDAVTDVIHKCLDMFVQYVFVMTPIIHEPTLRASVSLFGPDSHPQSWALLQPASYTQAPRASPLKAFTLITALCAAVTSVIPDELMAQRHSVSISFLTASRAMHRIYEDYDREHPDSSSLVIRIWYSTALQNITGCIGTSYHYLWEATLIAQRLRLYEEDSVRNKATVESQLLRTSFWQLFSADKASCAFENRPYVLNELLFAGDLTLLERGENDEPLLEATKSFNQGSLESRLLAGFHLKRCLWSLAGDLVMDIKMYARRNSSRIQEPDLAHLTDSYLKFMGLADDLPPWLQYFNDDSGSTTATNTEVLPHQKTCFFVQRNNLMTTFHCLKLIILQKCIECNTLVIMGLENQALPLAIKKIEIVYDFLQELQMTPFVCIKVQGEPVVERIRRVGSILLELTETVENDRIKARSSALFKRILDFLSKLDSKASDTLHGVPGLSVTTQATLPLTSP